VRTSLIRNNVLYGNHASGIAGWDDGDGNEFGTQNNRILGNTIVQPSGSRFAIGLLNGSTGNLIRDNILLHLGTRGSISADPTSQPGLSSDYNVVVDRFSDDDLFFTFAQWRGFGFDAHSFIATAAALFVDPVANDYHLSATSPARDAGIAHAEPAGGSRRDRATAGRWGRHRRLRARRGHLADADRDEHACRARRPRRRPACRSRCRVRCRRAAARRCRRRR
jgi:hypothetical protein